MTIKIVEIQPAQSPKALNTEWFVLENIGETSFSTQNCTLSVSRKGSKKRKQLGTLDPGFSVAPGERVRILTGNPGKKSHGKGPDEGRNYNLFLASSVLMGKGTVLTLRLRSHVLAIAEFDPNGDSGVAAESAGEQ